MGSLLVCPKNQNHKNRFKRSRLEFLECAAKDNFQKCSKCESKLDYTANHFYPNDKQPETLTLEKVRQIKEKNPRYKPFLLILRSNTNHKIQYWLQYWVKVDGKWKYGQYAPLLNKKQMKFVSRNL